MVGRVRIPVDSGLIGRAFTFPVAAIINRQNVGPETGISFQLIQLLPDIRSIAVKPEEDCGAGRVRQKPRIQTDSVFSSKPDFFQPHWVNSRGRKPFGIAGWKKYKAV